MSTDSWQSETLRERIAPIIRATYGDTPIADALVLHLVNLIWADDWDSRGREHNIMLECWNWFSGGTTAESVARKIEAALP